MNKRYSSEFKKELKLLVRKHHIEKEVLDFVNICIDKIEVFEQQTNDCSGGYPRLNGLPGGLD